MPGSAAGRAVGRGGLSRIVFAVSLVALCGATLPFYLTGQLVRDVVEGRYAQFAPDAAAGLQLRELAYTGGLYRSRFAFDIVSSPRGRSLGIAVHVDNSVEHGWFSARIRSRLRARGQRPVPQPNSSGENYPVELDTSIRMIDWRRGDATVTGELRVRAAEFSGPEGALDVMMSPMRGTYRMEEGRLTSRISVPGVDAETGGLASTLKDLDIDLDISLNPHGAGAGARDTEHPPWVLSATIAAVDVRTAGLMGGARSIRLYAETDAPRPPLVSKIRVRAAEASSRGVPYVSLRELVADSTVSLDRPAAGARAEKPNGGGSPDGTTTLASTTDLHAASNYGPVAGRIEVRFHGRLGGLSAPGGLEPDNVRMHVSARLPAVLAAALARADTARWKALQAAGILTPVPDGVLVQARLQPGGGWVAPDSAPAQQ